MPTVALVNQFVPQYRVPAWEGLRVALDRAGVRLRLLQGRPHRSFAPRADTVTLEWAETVPMREFRVGGKELVYLELGDLMRTADLVISNQEVRLLHNFRLLEQQMRGRGRFALMGHGRDSFKRAQPSLSEQLKIWMSRRVHWWFAYNEFSARQVEAFGYPKSRITTFMNSTDTRSLRDIRDRVPATELAGLRRDLGLGTGPVGIYVGAIDPIKEIGYLLDGARRVREAVPAFELLMLGSGPERERFEAETAQLPWVHWVGPQFGEAKVRYMLLADVCLLPAGVGLGIVDTFALGTPLITTDRYPHGVEIDYLEHGRNGWLCRGGPTAADYGDAVVRLLRHPLLLKALRQGALDAGERYSIEAMVRTFCDGVLAALHAPRR